MLGPTCMEFQWPPGSGEEGSGGRHQQRGQLKYNGVCIQLPEVPMESIW